MKKIFSSLAILLLSSVATFAQDDPNAAAEGSMGYDIVLGFTYILIAVAGIAAIVLPIMKSSGEKGGLMKSLIMVGGVVVLFIIGYIISGNEVTATYEKFGITPNGSKFVGGAIITVYILVFVAFLGFIASRIKDLLNL